MASLIRALRSRAAALAAVVVTVGLAAAFAALATTAWSVALPLGARADVAASPADSFVLGDMLGSAQAAARANQSVLRAVAQDAPGVFALEQTLFSQPFALPGTSAGGVTQETYAVSEPAVRAHAQLTEGSWPSAAEVAGPHGSAVPVALPSSAANLMGLRIGQSLTLSYAPLARPTTFLVVGEFRYLDSGSDQAALAWNAIGPAGVDYADASAVQYGPLVAASAAFTGGSLPFGSGSWTLTPIGAPDTGVLQNAVQSVTGDVRLSPSIGFTSTDVALTEELAAVSSRLTVGRGELLTATCLLGLLAGLALAAAAEGLVARGAAQTALMRSRGAPAWKAAVGYLPDAALLFPAAALGTFAQGPLAGRLLLKVPPLTPSGGALGLGLPGADWVAGLCVAGLAALIVLARAARAALPAQVAAASGRQAAVSGLALAGVDLALVALAGIALWQCADTGLTTGLATGGSGIVLIVACAPALTAAAGAALCGRLITTAARLSERAARRAGALPLRLAAWELARTPRRHLIPALLSVAAVAGCGFAAAQHASWQRSTHDQAAYQVGADVAVNLAQPQPLDAGGQFARAPGVRSATPVYQSVPDQGPVVIALAAGQGAATVTLRSDQADRPLPQLWSAVTPSAEPGLAVPGDPVGLGIRIRLYAPGLSGTTVTVTVEDATGTTYPLALGNLPADGVEHTLQLPLAASGSGIAYPLRIVGIALGYQLPMQKVPNAGFSIDAVTAQDSAGGPYLPIGAAPAAIEQWLGNTTWNPQDLMTGCGPSFGGGQVSPPSIVDRSRDAAGVQTSFAPGEGFSLTPCAITLTAGNPDLVIPAIATTAYLTASQQAVGAVVSANIDQISVQARIVAAVESFPTATGPAPQALIVDLGELSDLALLHDDPVPPASTWWLSTADGATPPNLPATAVVVNAAQVQAALADDPSAAIPQRVSTVGAAALTLLALLGLLVSLLSAARDADERDTVLCALGMTRTQRAALGCAVHTAVALPAALLGALLGFLLARLLVPEFILSPAAAPPVPTATVLYAANWSALAFAAITVCIALASFAASARRRDPSVVSRWGG
jgi:hypothetical protein